MRVGGAEVIQGIETNIAIETRILTDTRIVIWIVKGLESGAGEVVGMERENGGTRMVEMEAGIGTIIAAGPVPLVDIVTGGPREVLFADISAILYNRCFGFERQ